jgi:hypothetical protein
MRAGSTAGCSTPEARHQSRKAGEHIGRAEREVAAFVGGAVERASSVERRREPL